MLQTFLSRLTEVMVTQMDSSAAPLTGCELCELLWNGLSGLGQISVMCVGTRKACAGPGGQWSARVPADTVGTGNETLFSSD